MNDKGYAKVTHVYNENWQKSKTHYSNTEDELTLVEDATWLSYEYGDDSKRIISRQYDLDDELIIT